MERIPTINLVALLHLWFVAAFMGVYACEAVMELYAWFRPQDAEAQRMTARYHYWIDTVVEIPTLLAVAATGIWMAFLVEKLTTMHWVLIACVAAMVPGALACIFTVRKRRRLVHSDAPAADLRVRSRRIIGGTALFVNPFLLAVLLLGSWLAWHRVLDSIY